MFDSHLSKHYFVAELEKLFPSKQQMKNSFDHLKISILSQWDGYLFFLVFAHYYYSIRTLLEQSGKSCKKARFF